MLKKGQSFTKTLIPYPLIIIMIISLLSAYLLLPGINSHLPNDLKRYQVIIKKLNGFDDQSEPVIFFGSSVVLAGINSAIIKEEVYPELDVYNFATADQHLEETLLFLAKIPENTSVVFLGIRADQLSFECGKLADNKITAFSIYGYNFKDDARTLVLQAGNQQLVDQFNRSKFKDILDSRWMIRSSIDTGMRQLLRPDFNFRKSIFDLTYPNIYQGTIGKEKSLTKALNKHSKSENFLCDESAIKTIFAINDYLFKKDIPFYLIIMPDNQEVIKQINYSYSPSYDSTLVLLEKDDSINLFDFKASMTEQYFYDDVHLNNEGGNLFSMMLSKALVPLNSQPWVE